MRETNTDVRNLSMRKQTTHARDAAASRPRRIVVYVSMIRRRSRVPSRWRSSRSLVAPRFPSRRGGGLHAGDSRGLDAATAAFFRGVRTFIFTWRARIPWRRRRRVRRRGRRRRRGRGGTRRRHPRMGSFRTWPPDARCTSWPPRLSTRARASARGTPRDHARDGEVPIREKEQVPARLGESRTRERDPRSTLIRTLARAPSEAHARTPSTRSP